MTIVRMNMKCFLLIQVMNTSHIDILQFRSTDRCVHFMVSLYSTRW
jgi:hypothetical protein